MKKKVFLKHLVLHIKFFITFIFVVSIAQDKGSLDNQNSLNIGMAENNISQDSQINQEISAQIANTNFSLSQNSQINIPQNEILNSDISEFKNDRLTKNDSDVSSDHADNSSQLVNFDLQSKTLSDLILALAEFKKFNILVPSTIEADKVVVNFSLKDKISVEEAEEYLIYFLDMAGYALIKQDNFFVVTKKGADENLKKDNLPLYVNVSVDEIPENASLIRVIHILNHVRVPTPQGTGSEAVKKILLEMLPAGGLGVLIDVRTNAIILTGPANSIGSILLLLNEIDNAGEPDYVNFLTMQHTQAAYVYKLVESILSVSKNDTAPGFANAISYFSPHLKMILDSKQNSLIILGEKTAVEKITNFIETEIDIPEKDGKSLIHVYELQYLDPKKIAPILQELVNGAGQKEQSNKENTNSLYRKFDSCRIIPEENIHVKRNAGEETKLSLAGSNKLIIAATEADFIELSKIIETLDNPQPQIIIEIIIFDLHLSDIKNFSSNAKNPSFFNLPFASSMQSIMMDSSRVILQNQAGGAAVTSLSEINPLTSMNSNLLANIQSGDGGNAATSLVNTTPRNGLVISLGEGDPNKSIWSLLQLEQFITKRNVIENPTVITQNNTPAKILNVVVKRGAGELSPNNTQYGGATVVNIQSYTAALGVSVTPRISFGGFNSDDLVRLNLQININIEDFKNDAFADYTKYNRSLITNANISSGDILVLGGLTKESTSEQIYRVPILGDIPLIGSLFRKKVLQKDYSDLYVCIRATVINSQDEINEYTSKQTDHYKSENCENLLSNFVTDYASIKL
jgi:general secretion pathway protein D